MTSLSSSQLAKATGTGTETLRYYERIGLLREPPRSPAGHRRYEDEDLQRVRFIRHSQSLGFSLEEIQHLLALRIESLESCGAVADSADHVIERIDSKLAKLTSMRRSLQRLRASCETRVTTTTCPILDALEDDDAW